MYGPGIYLTTNSQRYRNVNDFRLAVPDGKFRMICSGDSFTLGYGVNDDQTWCHLLTSMDNRVETVNLGQGGYGVDQAYLWYKRNENKLEHDIHIFAFITQDFSRMESDTFTGYGKPYLLIMDGAIVQQNKPVSKRSYYAPWLTKTLRQLGELKTVRLLDNVAERLGRHNDTSLNANHSNTRQDVVTMIFSELQLINHAKDSSLVLVYLPSPDDYPDNTTTTFWKEFVQAEAQDNGYLFIDVIEELQSVRQSPLEIFSKRHWHYTVEGNKYVANILHDHLNKVFPGSGKIPQ